MRFLEIVLENVGLYSGRHAFDLTTSPDDGSNVVTILGHNGGGKTTFLDAIRLALYGRKALGPRTAQSTYDDHLLRKISATASSREASITLSFVRGEGGQEIEYSVKRAWASRGKSVVESLDLIREGRPISDLERPDFAHYVEELVPPGLSQLFFFDGEKIQEIADDEGSVGLRDAIRSLLGLDIIDQLQTDLTVYTSRRADRQTSDVFERLLKEKANLEAELARQQEARAELQSSCDQAARRVERAEIAYRGEGGEHARSREDVLAQIRSAEDEHADLGIQLKRMANDLLPLSLAPDTVQRLQQASARTLETGGFTAIKRFIDTFERRENVGEIWTEQHFQELRAGIETETSGSSRYIFAEPDWILRRIDALSADRKADAAELAKRFDQTRERRAKLKLALEGFDSGHAEAALANLKEAERKLGALERDLQLCDEGLERLLRELETIERRFKTEETGLKRLAQESRGADLAVRAQGALAIFGAELLKDRVLRLETEFVECFNRLSRKKTLVSSVRIDPADFSVTLIGSDGVEIEKNGLSAGERQIYAISMLWALGKTSGRQLPIVIDTPFSRLDQSHRKAIVQDYLPSASHQVILLCTDTEMTPALADHLSPHIARTYRLEATTEARSTTLFPVSNLAEELV